MRYIKGTLILGINYQKFPQRDILDGLSDADSLGDKDTRRSTSGYCFILVGGIVSWGRKKNNQLHSPLHNRITWHWQKQQLNLNC